MRVHGLQHVDFEGLGHIQQWIMDRGHSLTMTRFYAGESLPALGDFDRLVIMGGPMNIYEDDQYPWLADERAFIREALAAGKSAVGVCLGAQLLADALGSKVYKGHFQEIGWLPIQVTPEGRTNPLWQGLDPEPIVLHWHGDTFDVPAGTVHLAKSEGCNSQAFLYENRVLGLQFHMESTPATVQSILANCGHEIVKGPYVQSAEHIAARAADPATFTGINRLLETLLDRLA